MKISIKKEWLFQGIVLLLFYLDSIMEVDHEGIHFSNSFGIDFLFLLYHVLLFLMVNYLLIPKLFTTKKYALFFIALISLIIFFGIIEEGVVEKILSPNHRGANAVTWQSVYWFTGEIIVPLLAFMTIKFTFDNFAKQQELERVEKNNLTNELKLLKSQMQPHILFNSLNNLYNFTLSKSDKAPDLVLKLSNVLRYMLYETNSEKVPLSKELAFIEDYIDLQKVQFEGRGTVDYMLTNSEKEELLIAPFILIPFIENSFKHSFGTKIKGIIIQIKIEIKEKKLQLWVNNNFETDPKKGEALIYSGIGLKNVKKRLNLVYPHQYQLDIKKIADDYQVYLDLKLS